MRDVARRKRMLSTLGARRRRLMRVRPGTPPGTLVASDTPAPSRVSVLTWTRTTASYEEVPSVDVALAKITPGAITWINVDGLGDVGTLAKLGERFGLHPLALEDVLNVPQRPKVERYDNHMFVVMRTMRLAEGAMLEEQVSLFFGADWLVTVQERSDGDCFGAVRDAMQRMRHELLALRRAVWPMREEVGILLREDSPLIATETRVFLRDVYDHAVQALEIVESLRETAVAVMEVYLSVQNQHLNETMKVLTIIATLFIPLTFIASIYGMNFRHMPELDWRYGYAWALGLMAITAVVLIAYFRRKGWW